MSDGERGRDLGHAETLAGAGGAPGAAATLVAPVDSAGETLAGSITDATSATIRGTGVVGGDHATLLAVDDRAYAIGAELARGGMGKILSARDRRLHRDVVIKVTRGDALDPRFEREALITARLQHPSIVRVYEAGVLGDGRAFYAMERVRGRGLDAVIAEATTLRARIALLPHAIAVADALAYAHSERIVHRDLKPSNVLIGPFGETVVIDWGLAKDLRLTELDGPAHDSGADISLTRVGSVLGTPSHMAPEQARGETSDERSDVYAIGALLYHMLTGAPPHEGASVDDVLQRVGAGVHAPILERAPQLPPELAAIVERALSVRPADRFATAVELADELRRYASGQLVASHAYSLSRLIRRWLWRHRAAVSIAAIAIVVVAVVGVVTIREVLRARDAAAEAARVAEFKGEVAERKADDFVIAQARAALDDDPSRAAAQLGLLSASGIDRPAAHEIAVAAAKLGLAWELRGHSDDVEHLVVAPDGGHVATASDDATIRWWSVADPAQVVVLRGHTGPIDDLVISPDGNHLASAGSEGAVWLWDPAIAAGTALEGHSKRVKGIAFSPDSTELVSTSDDGTLWLWSVATRTGKVLARHAQGLRAVQWVGDTIYVGAHDGAVGRFDPRTGKGGMAPAASAEIRSIAVAPDGRTYATADKSGAVILWKQDGTKLAQLGTHTEIAREILFAPDGKHLASCGGDAVVRVYDPAAGTAIALAGNQAGIKDIDISPDGALVASAGFDGVVRVWPIGGGVPTELRGHHAAVKHVGFGPAPLLVSGSEDDRARIWRLAPPPPPPSGTALRAWLAAHTNLDAVAH